MRDKASEELDHIEDWKLDTNIMICKEPSDAYLAIFIFSAVALLISVESSAYYFFLRIYS